MALTHEFGILYEFDLKKNYNEYTPEQYHCISIEDNLINNLIENLFIMKSYFHSFNRPESGLAYYGITIIPPESLSIFFDVVTSSRHFKNSAQLNELASKIRQATEDKKYMIHYGI